MIKDSFMVDTIGWCLHQPIPRDKYGWWGHQPLDEISYTINGVFRLVSYQPKDLKNTPEELYYAQTFLAYLSPTCQERYEWDFKAAQYEYVPAQIDIAFMYLSEGCLGKADTIKAIEWYSKAAKNKDFKSAYFIAKKYTQDYLDLGAKDKMLRKSAYLWQIISNEFKEDYMKSGGTLNFFEMLDTRKYQARLQNELSKKEITDLKKDAEIFLGQPLKKYESMVAGKMEIFNPTIPPK